MINVHVIQEEKKNPRNRTYTNNEYITKASNIHNNFFDYSKLKYVNYFTKVCIICPKHGEFFSFPGDHLKGTGCAKCKNMYRYK